MQIKIKEITEGCMPKQSNNGDWIDLYVAEDTEVLGGEVKFIPLGIAMELPEGYEAIIEPRSSTIKKWGLHVITGIIDNSFNGDNDEWRVSVEATRPVFITKGTRLCQFRIQENQPSIELTSVDTLGNENRGGFGSTGV